MYVRSAVTLSGHNEIRSVLSKAKVGAGIADQSAGRQLQTVK